MCVYFKQIWKNSFPFRIIPFSIFLIKERLCIYWMLFESDNKCARLWMDGWVGGWGILGDRMGGCSRSRHVGVSWARGRQPTTYVSDTCKQVGVIFMIISGRKLSGWLEPIENVGNHRRNSWPATPQKTTTCETIDNSPEARRHINSPYIHHRKGETNFIGCI